MAPKLAWEACGKPSGEAGIQNIQRRGLEQRRVLLAAKQISVDVPLEKSTTALEDEQAPTIPRSIHDLELPGSGNPRQGFRLKPTQVEATLTKKKILRAAYDAAFIAATNEWHNLVTSGRSGGQKDGTTAKAIAQRYSSSLPDGSPKLTARSLYNAYREGRGVGASAQSEASAAPFPTTWCRASPISRP